jgi:hypothetical protein
VGTVGLWTGIWRLSIGTLGPGSQDSTLYLSSGAGSQDSTLYLSSGAGSQVSTLYLSSGVGSQVSTLYLVVVRRATEIPTLYSGRKVRGSRVSLRRSAAGVGGLEGLTLTSLLLGGAGVNGHWPQRYIRRLGPEQVKGPKRELHPRVL